MISFRNERGFTLTEVIVVIIIMGILAATAMRMVDSGLESSRVEETRAEMNQIAEAISGNSELFSNGYRSSFGYVGDVGAMPANLDALVTNPGLGTWKGPYVSSDFTNFSDDYKRDAWGQLYIYSGATTIKALGSAPDTLTRVICSSTSDLTSNSLSVTVTDAAGNPPGDSASKVTVILSFPDGVGATTDSTKIVNSSGNAAYSNCVPIGNQRVRAVFSGSNDTVETRVCVLPRSSVQATLRFRGAPFAASGGGGASSLFYVTGTAIANGTGNGDLTFDIENPTTTSRLITSIKLTYSNTAYFQIVKWDAISVFNNNNPRAGSDETVTFSSGQSIGSYGQRVIIKVQNFKSIPIGIGSDVDMTSTTFTVTLSDGSTFTFITP